MIIIFYKTKNDSEMLILEVTLVMCNKSITVIYKGHACTHVIALINISVV